MARPARKKSKSGIYHLMVRGANRQEIFHDDEDRHRYLDTLGRYKKEANLGVYGWCVMGNHVHLLLKEGKESLSDTMKRIGVSYVWFYNQKYSTTGHLFQGRFSSEAVDSEDYFKTVIRYIHQNPLKAGFVKKVEEWRWSSYPGYYGSGCIPKGLLDPGFALSLFAKDIQDAKRRFLDFHQNINTDQCLEMEEGKPLKLSDEEVRSLLTELLEGVTLAQVKSLPKPARDAILRKAKAIEGASYRQIARILGISPNLINKA